MTIPVLTIDGPSGSGKGTVAAILAQKLSWHILDSGALYRLAGLTAERKAIDLKDISSLVAAVSAMQVEFADGKVLLDGEDVSLTIRTEQAGNAASKVAAIGEVREALLQWQRDFVKAPGLVADGRDMGTVVFPQTPVKIFLDASAEERAQRRYKQLIEKGLDANLMSLVAEIQERDDRDRNRAVAPLKPADDALVIDSSEMSIDSVVEQILQHMKLKLPDVVVG